MSETVYFRADGNSRIGLGHTTRSLALADMLSEHFTCVFLVQNPTSELDKQIGERHALIHLPETDNYLAEAEELSQKYLSAGGIVVLDGYEFRTEYQRILKASGCKLVCIDDLHAWHFVADAVVNHAGGITARAYSCEKSTQLYLGPGYALLREPFLEMALGVKKSSEEVSESVLIAMGGADTDNHTLQVLKKINSPGHRKHLHVVIGSAYTHHDELHEFIDDSNLDVRLHSNLNSADMAGVMSVCGSAITPPSGISYEYLCTGKRLFLKMTAANQQKIYNYLINNSFALDFEEEFSLNSPTAKKTLSLIDGHSPERIRAIFTAIAEATSIHMRKAARGDVDQYYEWANETEVRQNAVTTKPIIYQDHVRWFGNKLESSSSLLYYFSKEDRPVGQVRFDWNNGKIVIDYSLDPSFRGKGLGKVILTKAIEALSKESSIWQESKLFALVKESNHPSCKIFISLNFQQLTPVELDGQLYRSFVK